MQLESQQERHQARLDRAAYHKAPGVGHQMAFAMVDAATRNTRHPLTNSIVRVVEQMERRSIN